MCPLRLQLDVVLLGAPLSQLHPAGGRCLGLPTLLHCGCGEKEKEEKSSVTSKSAAGIYRLADLRT